MSNVKIIYSLKIHMYLLGLGFKPKVEMKNPMNERFNCWVYDATPQLLEAFDKYLVGTEG